MRILHEVNARSVDMVVCRADLWVFGSDLVEGALPQSPSKRQHVGLVHQGEVLTFPACSQVKGVANAPLDTHPSIH